MTGKRAAFTPERILALTGIEALAARAAQALAAIRAAGISEDQAIDWAFAIHCGRSTADEYGLDKATLEPVLAEGEDSVMEHVVQELMLLAAVTDPDGGAPALFFGNEVVIPPVEPRINLINFVNWVTHNHPVPTGACDVSAAMEALLEIIAEERGVPELAKIHELPDGAEPPRIEMDPYIAVVVVEGDPNDPGHVGELLDMTSQVPIHWIFIYISNQPGYLAVYEKEVVKHRRNIHFVAFPQGGKGLVETDAFERITAGLGDWYKEEVERGLIPAG